MKQPIRYFAIGLFTASVVLLIIVSFIGKSDNDAIELPIEEMTEILQKEGYHVLSSAEYITLSMNNEPEITENEEEKDSDQEKEKDEDKKEVDKDKDKDKDQDKEDEPKESEVKKYKLIIEPNMLGPTISELLEEKNIIEDAEDFNRYLETEGYAEYIQLGEFELSSNMSNFEIAEKIAKKR